MHYGCLHFRRPPADGRAALVLLHGVTVDPDGTSAAKAGRWDEQVDQACAKAPDVPEEVLQSRNVRARSI